jgi:hypothetical protein
MNPMKERIPEPIFHANPLMHYGALRLAALGAIVKINRRILLVAFAACLLVSLMPAQSTVPQSYTLTVSSAMALEAMSTGSAVEARVSRFGPREFVDVTGGAPASKAIHARHWFDLVTHKVYTLDVVQNTCSWMSFTAPDMPAMYDPIASPPPSAADLAAFNKNVVRRENVNGIAAKLSESSSAQGKMSIWAAENGNYPVKAVMTFPGAQPMLMQEVKELHFVKPDIALLVPPANCMAHAQGEWTATGMSGHFDLNIDAEGSGSVDLKTGKATGDATVKSSKKPR